MAWSWTLALVAGVLSLLALLFWFWRLAVRVRWRQRGVYWELDVWLQPVLGVWIKVPRKLLEGRLRWYRRRLLPEIVRAVQRRWPGAKPPVDDGQPDPAAAKQGGRPGLPVALYLRITRLVRWRLFELEARVGTGDAASAALLIGALRAGLPMLVAALCAPGRGRWYLRIDPDFADAHLAVEFNGIWSVSPGQAMVAGFTWWRQARARRRSQREKARRGTGTWSIPSRG